ncbi:SusC/RagA family TonB-linked outer membrane protein [Pedobacter caeni]|uniref:TonB-linked outer membrane protein, SusC/RagA family n=1 Tax=Pedobacter caeni TaxID=288992 RepID=A0A1M5EL98_9SPHI|nr:SusC/RagA family TonB-linked outer membrane protein [Pedobacter caeni]SHF79900.1 TonB-linked outer membrane protein, SusC/RagA family [Pedobacter caeni]
MMNFYGKALPIFRKCMRISTIIIGIQVCFSTLLMAKHIKAQEMSFKVVKASVKQVFKKIEQQANVTFVYDEQVLGRLPNLTLNFKNEQLSEVLKSLREKTSLEFKLVGNYIGVAENAASMPNLSLSSAANSNRIKINGVIRDATGQPLIGVSVKVKGTQIGASTNSSGQFSIDANIGDVLEVSYLGYITKQVTITSPAALSVLLDEDSKLLSEVVVTALGIKKEKKALGYSVTEVKGEELTQARENNVINSLVGKVAGLNVNSIAGGVGASSNVIIRGVSSISQTNQPLYVVNGIPMENRITSPAGSQYDNTPDLGDAIGNLNPDDIETVSVLKGAAASALYGSRGKAGVILITTKSGKGNSIEFNSNFVLEKVMDMTDWQYTYGLGANGKKPANQLEARQTGQSNWGERLDGSNVIQFDGVSRPYVAQKNNMENFFRTGSTSTNTLALNKSFDGGSVRFSASNLTNKAITPNSGLNRQSFNLNGNYNISKNFTVDARANYILEQAKNRPFLSDGAGNSSYNITLLPTSLDVNVLKRAVDDDGKEFAYSGNSFATNPWFAANKFINNTKRERLLSSVSLRYNFDNGAFIQGRAGRDAYNDRYTSVVPSGTAYRPNGTIIETSTKFSDINTDVLLGKSFKVSDFTISPNIGGSYRRTKSEIITLTGNNFAVPYVYVISNAKIQETPKYIPSESVVSSLYATLDLSYKNFLYLNSSIRNDWYSTLATPGKNNKLDALYPSVNASFVFSEVLKQDWLSFGKLRAGFAQVGQATDPYQTQLAYNFNNATLNGKPLGVIANGYVPNSGLKASIASEFEIGTEVRFLSNRLTLDLTWYNKKSKDEIVKAPASIASGYAGAILNIGELRNTGIEALISGIPVQTKDFRWTTTLNGSVNNNTVVSLSPGQTILPGGTSRTGDAFTQNIVGLPYGQVMAFDYQYDANGNVVLKDGVPQRGLLKAYGSAYAKYVAGWNNEFSYKGVNLSFLIDSKFGGKIFSATDQYAYNFGLHKGTLARRDELGEGAAKYYETATSNVSGTLVQSSDFIKLRQVMLGYTFPGKLFNNVIKGATLSAVGRNLFYLKKKTDNIDPESDYSINAKGLELGGVPPVRTFGLNLSVKF